MIRAATAGLFLLAASAPAFAQSAPHKPAVTKHTAFIDGQTVVYTATVSEDVINDDQGKPGGAIVTIAYTRDGVKDLSKRPVLFAFNGGPGASSSPLHLSAMGPIVRGSDNSDTPEGSKFYENATSPLDTTDLVFIDPMSTGFSRAFPGVDPKQWYGGKADAVEVATVIKDWIKAHHREASPKFMAGESYGTTRAGLIVKYAPDLKFNGVILVSGGGGGGEPNARNIDLVATATAAAWFHKKSDVKAATANEAYAEGMKFARGDYAAALAQGDSLSPADMHAMAERVAHHIGLPVALVEEKKLKPSENDWMFNVLKDEGLRAGKLDSRATGKWCENMQGGIDDPAMGFVSSTTCAPADKPPTAANVGPKESPAVGKYITETLKFADSDPYYGVNFTANSQWARGQREPGTAEIIADAMKTDPHLRLAAISGFFDLGSGDGSGFAKVIPADRLSLLRLAGGHEVYNTAFGGGDDRKIFDDAVRKFVTAK